VTVFRIRASDLKHATHEAVKLADEKCESEFNVNAATRGARHCVLDERTCLSHNLARVFNGTARAPDHGTIGRN